jgi:transcription antitermination factor NusG
MESWHILRTKPGQERHVAVQLHQRGPEVYLPLVWVNPINPRAARQRPFFPCYLFAKFDEQDVDPTIIRWAPGLRSLVTCADQPVVVSDAFIKELQQRLDRIRAVTNLSLDGCPQQAFYRIDAGPFAGFEGLFSARLKGPDRARMLLACALNEFYRQNAG